MEVYREKSLELAAVVRERDVQLQLERSDKARIDSECGRLEALLQTMTPRRAAEPGYDRTRDAQGFDKAQVEMGTHAELLALHDSTADVERIADATGLMVHSLQKKDAQIAALQDLYAAATTQAASARRQAEAATMLNENLILARTAPHHDAGEDARILIANLRSRAQEQDKFVGALMKRLATLEHFILEEKQLVVQRAAEHVGNKLVESTRRFNVYARKAAEREQFLARCAPHGSDTVTSGAGLVG
jgi:hypothetical protein